MAIALLTYSLQATTMDELERLTGKALEKGKIDLYMQEVKGFDKSDYPYYEGVNGCGGEDATSEVPDHYIYPVTVRVWRKNYEIILLNADFRKACNNHDRCYMTAEESQDHCDFNFDKDLATACYEGEIKNLSGIIKNAVMGLAPLSVCLGLAVDYAIITASIGDAYFPNANRRANKYKTALNDMFSTEPDKQNTWYECRKEHRNNLGNLQKCFQEN